MGYTKKEYIESRIEESEEEPIGNKFNIPKAIPHHK